MNGETRSIWWRLVLSISAGVIVSLAILFAAARYLSDMVAEEYRTGARLTTDGDSIGLPLGALALLLGLLVITINVILAIVLFRKGRRPLTGASRPAA